MKRISILFMILSISSCFHTFTEKTITVVYWVLCSNPVDITYREDGIDHHIDQYEITSSGWEHTWQAPLLAEAYISAKNLGRGGFVYVRITEFNGYHILRDEDSSQERNGTATASWTVGADSR